MTARERAASRWGAAPAGAEGSLDAHDLRRAEQQAMAEVAKVAREQANTLPLESETRRRLLRDAELREIAAGPFSPCAS